ncbi:MAG: hypothetical protein ACI3W5_05460 [Faecousia sp.]
MKHISAITIYNNEGMHYDTQRRYMIKMRPHGAVIEYQDLMKTDMCEVSAFCSDFRDIETFLLAQLSGNLGKSATYDKLFLTPKEYERWRRSTTFTDYDVAWCITVEFLDGKIAAYVSIESQPSPTELDQLELLVKEALGLI